jgi:acyl-CoA synthetase (AMP-forming)/AMP-acid ligase II
MRRRVSVDFLPDPAESFPTVFTHYVDVAPEAIAFHEVTVIGRELQARPFTFAQLAGMARRAAAILLAHGVGPGDRVLLALSAPDSFLAFFLGTQGLGAVPVPLPAPGDTHFAGVFRERVRAVAADCNPRAVVLEGRADWDPPLSETTVGIRVVEVIAHDLRPLPSPSVPGYEPCRSLDEVAYLQYTSGSTGSPKGVIVTQRNLVANFRASAAAAALGPDDRNFSWLPLFHDMGLIGGFLQTVYLRIPTFVMAPKYFLARPDSWLRAIDRFKITLSTGPNFAYNLLASRLPDRALHGMDLASWRLAFAGAEPLDHRTVEAFIRRFGPQGFRATSFYPVYGLAECTLSAAYPEPGVRPHYDTVDRVTLSRDGHAVPTIASLDTAVTFVSVGRAIPGHRLQIVEPRGNGVLPERHIGEIVITGPSVTPGYFQRTGLPKPSPGELRTGDLGYLADGELFIVDRLKDVLIVAGRNYVPSDIERVVGAVDGVRAGAVIAFTLPGADGTAALYVVAGTEAGAHVSHPLRNAVRWAVQSQIGIAPKDVCLVRPGVLPRTSSGKLQRGACRQLYESGVLQSEHSVPAPTGRSEVPSVASSIPERSDIAHAIG